MMLFINGITMTYRYKCTVDQFNRYHRLIWENSTYNTPLEIFLYRRCNCMKKFQKSNVSLTRWFENTKILRKIKFHIKMNIWNWICNVLTNFQWLTNWQCIDNNRENSINKNQLKFARQDKNWYYKSVS